MRSAPDSDGYLWIDQGRFRESFAQDVDEDAALVMAVTQKAPLGSTFGDAVTDPRGGTSRAGTRYPLRTG